MTTKPQEPWEQLGITEEAWNIKQANAQALAHGPGPGHCGVLQHPYTPQELAAQQRGDTLQANAHSVMDASPTLNPLLPPGYHYDKNGKKRKDRADKNTPRPQKAASAAPVSAGNACVHLNLHVSIADARALTCLISEEFPEYADTLQDEIIGQLTERLFKLGIK
jgi:hypothetical protein